MAEDDRTFRTSKPAANRAEAKGPGAGQEEMDAAGRAVPEGAGGVGVEAVGDLGTGTPPGVDVHDLGQPDAPEADWGDETDEGLTHSANHTRRGVKTEAERGQGRRTRQLNKDIVSRRN